PLAVDLAESIRDVDDGIVCGCVKYSKSAPDGCLMIAEDIPCKSNAWRDVVLVGRHRMVDVIHFVAQPELKGKTTFDLPSILDICAVVCFRRCNRGVSKRNLHVLGDSQIERLDRGDRCRSER